MFRLEIILAIIFGIIAFVLLGWKIFLGVFLMLWSINVMEAE